MFMDFFGSLWNLLVVFFWAFVLFSTLIAAAVVIADLFRDSGLNAWYKVLWVILLVFFPLLGSLIYLAARGRGMNERSAKHQRDMERSMQDYIRTVAGTNPTEEIARAKQLLDSGAITPEEFDTVKKQALAGSAPTPVEAPAPVMAQA